MKNKLHKKFGLLTAICMVVGIVIGSGVFFKAGKVLSNTGANIGLAALVVGIVGAIMLICSLVFATLGAKYEKVNGVVDYAEATMGKRFAYYVGWFMTTMYYPIIASTLAWVTAQYICILFGYDVSGAVHLTFAALILIGCYAVNALSPKIAGKFQVSATFIKLVPLIIMAVVGTIVGLVNGLTIEAFSSDLTGSVITDISNPEKTTTVTNNIFTAVCAFAFAYEGWIIATSINSELHNGKRNLPIALTFGAIIVVAVYVLYFIGISGVLSTNDMIAAGDALPQTAFTALFNSPVMGTIIMVFVVISCLGTTNGVMLGCCRGMYSLSVRNEGPAPQLFGQVDEKTNMPNNSAIIGLLLSVFWLFQWQVFFFDNTVLGAGKIAPFWCWEADEVCIITLYLFYIPMFIAMMVKCKDLHPIKRFVLPSLGVICCGFMCYCAFRGYSANGQIWSYLIVFAVIMAAGFFFSNDFKKLIAKRKGIEYNPDAESEIVSDDEDDADEAETIVEETVVVIEKTE